MNKQYDGLRKHLAYLTLIGPFITPIWEHIRREKLPASVGIIIQAWISDRSRLTCIRGRLIEANVLRRNRIVYAGKYWKGKGPALQEDEKTMEPKTLQSDLFKEQQTRHTPKLEPRENKPTNVTTRPLTEPATAIGPDFVMPKDRGTSSYTKITRTGIQQDYPKCPVSKGSFQCPYCLQVLPTDYAKEEEMWR
jgi:hypothetical protein